LPGAALNNQKVKQQCRRKLPAQSHSAPNISRIIVTHNLTALPVSFRDCGSMAWASVRFGVNSQERLEADSRPAGETFV
jgi:hypothetical protein